MRFAEIDVVRGVAVVTMILFHVAFDLMFMEIVEIPIWNDSWQAFAFFTQFIFIVSTGMTFAIASQRGRNRVPHALKLFGFGMLITGVTWWLFREQAVWFGILNFYGVSVLLGLLFRSLGAWNMALGAGWLVMSQFLEGVRWEGLWGVPLGFYGGNFQSLDYFPLFPWFGWFLIGMGFGSWFYTKKGRRWTVAMPPWGRSVGLPFAWLGRHSLPIYLVHQPVIVGLIWVVIKLGLLR